MPISVRNLGVTFDPHLSFSNNNVISNHSNHSTSRFMHIRDLRRIRPMLDSKTASTIDISVVHSKLDYCNSLFLNDRLHLNTASAAYPKLTRTSCYQNTQTSS